MPNKKFEPVFDQFVKNVRENDVLDRRTTVMLHLAVTVTIGCDQ